MKLLLFFLLLLPLSSYSDEFCVQTMNIYGPWKWRDPLQVSLLKRTEKIFSHLIHKENCELIALQEVWTKKAAQKIISLAEKQGYQARYHSFESKMSSGLLLLYKKDRLELEHSHQITFDRNAPGFGSFIRELPFVAIKKGFTNSTLSFESKQKIQVINIHLQPLQEKEDLAREQATQVSQLLNLYSDLELRDDKLPLIILGDFNSRPGSLVDRFIQTFFSVQDSYLQANGSYREIDCTYCEPKEDAAVIDFVYISADKISSIESAISPLNDDTRILSDHLSVESHLNFKALLDERSLNTQKLNILIEMKEYLDNDSHEGYLKEKQQISTLIKKFSK